jgi:hypothetical protein
VNRHLRDAEGYSYAELTTEQAGAAIVSLASDSTLDQGAYLLTAAGLRPAA